MVGFVGDAGKESGYGGMGVGNEADAEVEIVHVVWEGGQYECRFEASGVLDRLD